MHKLAVVWWVGGMWSCVRISCWLPFWSRAILRAILKENEARLFPGSRHQSGYGLGRLPSDPADSGTWSQLVPGLVEAPSNEVGLRLFFGLMEHNLDLMINDLRGESRSTHCQSVVQSRRCVGVLGGDQRFR